MGASPPSVGASLLAKNSQAPRSFRKHALSLTFFASKLAPTPFVLSCQCSFRRGSVPRPILLPSISIAVRKKPYSAIWCIRYSDT
ncbi:hypothetical protein EUX57_26780 [Pseudomonas orientalis]|uniref:Uncharacterized protein n=1 Tax=Pseudomonas orientalis TaxID=76758 RepID=A0A4Q7CT90_9PSED|nr:hypothetical protein EUX57_26780 [Pseudomonas orientalis]